MENTAVRLSILVALVVGALSMVGVPLIGIPILMLLAAFIVALLEIRHQGNARKWRVPLRTACYGLAVIGFSVLIWITYSVFAVDMKIRFITGGAVVEANPREWVRFAVQLTNRGRTTSLTGWGATLTLPDGKTYEGHINTVIGDTVDIIGADHLTTSITLLSLRPKPLEMRVRTTWTTPASGQTQITPIEPVSLTFMHLGPTELNKVILGI